MKKESELFKVYDEFTFDEGLLKSIFEYFEIVYSGNVHIVRCNDNSWVNIVESFRCSVYFVHSRLLRHVEHSIHVG